jgi:cyclophilin family peptidyl-prolyl cis-trans isomerase
MSYQQWSTPPKLEIDPKKGYSAILDTDQGKITLKLFADKTPITVNNFVFLARQGFYNGTIFHRVISDFMAQGPGYRFKDEFNSSLRHDKAGILSMANAGPNTNGSQFFITHLATPWLDNKHSIFGQVTEGMQVLLSIPPRDPSKLDSPSVNIKSVTILEQ